MMPKPPWHIEGGWHCDGWRVLSGAEESHLRALPEPDVSLSTHPAPVIPVASWHDADGPMTKQRGLGAGDPL
jgi:hypothetical protein